MRILIYSANFAPEPTGIGKYSGEMASWLAEHGHEVRVVAAPPYYPMWKVDRKYRWPPFRREQWRGVDVWRAPLWVPKFAERADSPAASAVLCHNVVSAHDMANRVAPGFGADRRTRIHVRTRRLVDGPAVPRKGVAASAGLRGRRRFRHGTAEGQTAAADCAAHGTLGAAAIRHRIDHFRPNGGAACSRRACCRRGRAISRIGSTSRGSGP